MKLLLLACTAAAAVLPAIALAASPAPKVTVVATKAWCRPASTGALAGGCYVTLTSTADDRLVAIETSAADHGEIHTMSMQGGVMRMRKLPDGVALPAGKAVALKPGAEHLMLIGPTVPIKLGAKVPMTLRFQNAAPVKLVATVRAPEAGQ